MGGDAVTPDIEPFAAYTLADMRDLLKAFIANPTEAAPFRSELAEIADMIADLQPTKEPV